jgi:hypothetical protein
MFPTIFLALEALDALRFAFFQFGHRSLASLGARIVLGPCSETLSPKNLSSKIKKPTLPATLARGLRNLSISYS